MARIDSVRPDAIRVRKPDRLTLVELRAVGGAEAGRVWALGMGTHTVGPALDSAVVLRGSGRQRGGQLTITADGEAWVSFPSVLTGKGAPSPVAGGPELRTIRPKDSRGTAWQPEDAREFRWPEGAELSICGTALRLVRHSSPALPKPDSEVARIEQTMLLERAVRCGEVPDAATLAMDVIGRGALIWRRRSDAKGRLLLRVGSSEGLSQARAATGDPNAQDAGRLAGRWILPGLPCGVDLAKFGVLGVSGAPEASRGLARWLIIQAATHCDPRNLGIRVFADPSAGPSWDWAGWLPHLAAQRGSDPAGPYAAGDPARVGAAIAELKAEVEARAPSQRPEILVVFDRAGLLREVEGVIDILAKGRERGVYSICLDAAVDDLVPECQAVARCSAEDLALTARRSPEQERSGITPDLVSAEWCERVAVALCAHGSTV